VLAMLSDLLAFLKGNPELTNALATVASVIVAGVALVVSTVSVFVARTTLKHQRTHNILSVKPIPIVTVSDHEDSQRIKVRNHGSGPLIIRSLHVTDGSRIEKALIDWMPDNLPEQLSWKNFAAPIEDRSVLPGREIVLLESYGDPSNAVFKKARGRVRGVLSTLTVVVQYTDIYDSKFTAYTKQLSWFGRWDDEASDRS
jgi:hypothetical protein